MPSVRQTSMFPGLAAKTWRDIARRRRRSWALLAAEAGARAELGAGRFGAAEDDAAEAAGCGAAATDHVSLGRPTAVAPFTRNSNPGSRHATAGKQARCGNHPAG